jgi:hypothetical protein
MPIRFIDMLKQFCQAVTGEDCGHLLQILLRKLHAPRRARSTVSIFHCPFENAGEQYPGITHVAAALITALGTLENN